MNKRLFTIVALNVALNVTALILAPAAATGADGKTFPGALCHPDGEVFTVFHSGGGLFNSVGFQVPDDPSDNFANFFSCPIVRDVMRGQANGIKFARVHVDDKSTSEDISCTLSSRSKTSPTVAPTTIEFATDSSSGSGQQQLDYPGLDSGLRGYYTFLCSIPALTSNGFSGIWFYDVEEKD